VREPLPYWAPMRLIGVMLLATGLIALIQAFARFVVEGLGTPVPVAAPDRLVVGGLYRYVRNPMYVAALAIIVGQALALGQLGLLLYAAALWLITAAFVRFYEEPALTRRFGADYVAYRRAVPAWWPPPAPLETQRARRTRRTMTRTPADAGKRVQPPRPGPLHPALPDLRPWQREKRELGGRFRPALGGHAELRRTSPSEILPEKGYEQRSQRGFGRYAEHEKGQTASFRPPVVLAAGPL
jgi:hypothetical protein